MTGMSAAERDMEAEKREKCRNCSQFDGARMCVKYRMIAEPGSWCKSFRMRTGGGYEVEGKSNAER